MKKIFPGLLLGLTLGALATWFALRPHSDAAPAKAEVAAAPAEKPRENPLRLTPAKRATAGIALAHPTSVTLAPEITAFGRVLDPAPFLVLVAELETARAAHAASAKDKARVEKLFAGDTNASAQAVELATAAELRDRTAVTSARARLLVNWGRKLADDASLALALAALEKGSALLRLDVLPGDAPSPELKTARVGLRGATEFFEAEILGAAPLADPQIQGGGFLAVIRGHTLPVGAALHATLATAGETQTALVVPRGAILYHEGSAWIYVLGEEDTFERKLVTLGRGIADGVVLASGAEAGEQIVTVGAQQLLSAELQSGGAATEEK